MDDKDIWRTAAVLLKHYSEDAAIIAANRADALLDLGDVEGQRVWRRVLGAVRELTVVDPAALRN